MAAVPAYRVWIPPKRVMLFYAFSHHKFEKIARDPLWIPGPRIPDSDGNLAIFITFSYYHQRKNVPTGKVSAYEQVAMLRNTIARYMSP